MRSAHARSTSQQRVTNRSVDACRLEDTERSFCPAPHRSDPPDGFGGTPREPGDGGVSLTPPQPRVLRAEGLWPGVAPLDGVDPARDATEPDGRLDDPGVRTRDRSRASAARRDGPIPPPNLASTVHRLASPVEHDVQHCGNQARGGTTCA